MNAAYVILALPLAGFLLLLLLGRRARATRLPAGSPPSWPAGRSWPPWWCGSPCSAEPADDRIVDKNIFTWIPVDGLHVNFGLQLDPLSITDGACSSPGSAA